MAPGRAAERSLGIGAIATPPLGIDLPPIGPVNAYHEQNNEDLCHPVASETPGSWAHDRSGSDVEEQAYGLGAGESVRHTCSLRSRCAYQSWTPAPAWISPYGCNLSGRDARTAPESPSTTTSSTGPGDHRRGFHAVPWCGPGMYVVSSNRSGQWTARRPHAGRKLVHRSLLDRAANSRGGCSVNRSEYRVNIDDRVRV